MAALQLSRYIKEGNYITQEYTRIPKSIQEHNKHTFITSRFPALGKREIKVDAFGPNLAYIFTSNIFLLCL